MPIRNEAGDIIRWFGTCTDIEDLKRSQAVVRQLLREVEQRERTLRETQAQLLQTAKLANIGELATGVAHEINNPLNNIALFVANLDEYLQAGSINTEKARRQIKQALDQVKKAARS